MRLDIVCERPIALAQGDGFTVLEDSEVRFASKGDSQLPIRLRRLLVQRTDGKAITLLTNDLERSGVDIAALYKARWQIELLFRWIKQHLHIRRFLGNNDNAIRLQLFAAMIAYALLRIAARSHRIKISILRFTDLVAGASSSAATSAPSTNPRPSTQAAHNAKIPKIRSASAMPDSPQTALRTAGVGGVRPKGWEGEIRISRRTLPRHPPDWDPGGGTLSRVQERGFPLLLVGVSA